MFSLSMKSTKNVNDKQDRILDNLWIKVIIYLKARCWLSIIINVCIFISGCFFQYNAIQNRSTKLNKVQKKIICGSEMIMLFRCGTAVNIFEMTLKKRIDDTNVNFSFNSSHRQGTEEHNAKTKTKVQKQRDWLSF